MTFDRSLGRLATLTEEELGRPWVFRGVAMDVRYALYHALEEEQRAIIAAPRAPTEASRVLSLAQGAFGDLRGLLAGLDDALLDRPPATGEWSLRETLAHLIHVERSYRAQTVYSSARTAAEPVKLADERRPKADPAHTAGGIHDIVEHLVEERAETDNALGPLPDAALARPTLWGGAEVDVRHRVHRFASHMAEHTIQCTKIVAALDVTGGDARAISRRIGAARGLHERRTDPVRLQALDMALEQKARASN